MNLGFTALGQISYSILPNNYEGFNLLQKYQKEVGMNAFNFIPFDDIFIKRLIKDIKSSCIDWDYTGVHKKTQIPEHALVIRNMLNKDNFEILMFWIQKENKRITIHCARGYDEYLFVTFYFTKKTSIHKIGNWKASEAWQIWEPNDGLRAWEAFICDLGAYDDSFQNLLKMVISKC